MLKKLMIGTRPKASMVQNKLLAVMILASVLGISEARASAVYIGDGVDMYLKQNTFPTDPVEEKVFLNRALSSEISGQAGSQTDPRLVMFSSTTDTLASTSGFATIKATDGLINSITVTAPGYLFEDLVFSVSLASRLNLNPNSNLDLVVTTEDKSGTINSFADWAAQSAWGNGENRIMVVSTEDNLMQSVTISSQIGMESIGGLRQIKQFEISGLTAVPVPAALWLFASGLLGLIGIARRTNV